MNKKVIFYIVLIAVIMVLVFFSQQAVSRVVGKTLISAASDKVGAYMAKGVNLAMPNIGSKISDNIQNGGEAIQNAVDQTKQKISDAEKNISNYFSGISNAIQGKENNSCPTTPTK